MWHASEFESRACQGQVTEDRVAGEGGGGRLLSGYGGGEGVALVVLGPMRLGAEAIKERDVLQEILSILMTDDTLSMEYPARRR